MSKKHEALGEGVESRRYRLHPVKRCAFLSTEDLAGFVTDDHLAVDSFRQRGWEVAFVPWRQRERSWREFDAAIIRSTWDYQKDPASFLSVLEEIERSGVLLANSLSIVRWNLSKTYLRELETQRVPVVPTLWVENAGVANWQEAFARLGAGEIIVKPVIGASAGDTYRLTRESLAGHRRELDALFHDRSLMIQPFISTVLTEGELSLFWFGGSYSHAVRKVPKPRDFRVQEEHGGEITPVVPSDECMRTALKVLEHVEGTPLYARVDLLRDTGGGFLLMELELIEPALYFRTDHFSAERFADAFVHWYEANTLRSEGSS